MDSNNEKEIIETRDEVLRAGMEEAQAASVTSATEKKTHPEVEVDVENMTDWNSDAPSPAERMGFNAREQANIDAWVRLSGRQPTRCAGASLCGTRLWTRKQTTMTG